MFRILALLSLALLAACAAPPPEPVAAPPAEAPRMPRGIVWTDGHGPVNVASAGGAPQCDGLSGSETAFALAQSNAVRGAAGLPGLQLDPRLQKAAQLQACDMARRGVMDHRGTSSTGPGMRVKQLGYRPSVTAENIAAGSSSLLDLQGTLREWATSSRHRQNTVIPQLRDMGIGHALSPDGRVAYWSVVYSAPR